MRSVSSGLTAFLSPLRAWRLPALLLALLLAVALPARAQTAYVDEHGNHLHSPVTATALAGGGAATLTVGWYVTDCSANNPIQYTDTLTISGNVNLILADGCSMTVASASQNAAINVATGNSLTIYAQSTGPTMGALTATGDNYSAGIGSSLIVGSRYAGTVNIYGGTVTAHGGDAGAGIGGGNAGVGGEINIYGGTVNATGGYGGAGIGGGVTGGLGVINGGTVNISGGTVTAIGDSGGAGIGGGSGAAGDTINISGGTVTATGDSGGAGIGGGAGGDSGGITIGGSAQVTATGGNAPGGVGAGAGIGSGGGDSDTGGVAGSVGAMVIQSAAIHSATGGASGSGGSYDGADIGSGGGASSGAGTGAFTFDDTGPSHGLYTTDCGAGSSVQYFGTITISGDVTLILADGCSMSVTAASQNAAINVQQGNSLTIDAQAGGTGSLTATGDNYSAGIGSSLNVGSRFAGTINIHGGTVTAHGGNAGAGIGGGNAGVGGTVNISGGTVNATGGFGGAGIGGGVTGGPGAVNGGTVNISGGTVTATGDSGGAGIGGGSGAAGDAITISGGTVTATGGAGFSTVGGGAGLGGGAEGDSGNITIGGGTVTVTATGGNGGSGGGGAGIGSGGGDSGGPAGSLGALAIQQAAAVSVVPTGGASSSGGSYNGAAIGLGGGAGGGTAATMLTVTASAGAGGGISFLGVWKFNAGSSPVFTITPDAGNAIASVLVNGAGNAAAVASGSATFSNISADNQTIAVTFGTAIGSVALTGVTAPATGGAAATTYAVSTTGVTAGAASWSPADATFAPLTAYTFTATVSTNSGYAFASAPTLAATVNGSAATSIVNNGDGTATVTYQFPRTKAAPALSAVSASPPGPLQPGDSLTLSATLSGAYPDNAGRVVTFTAGSFNCTGTTNSAGLAQCTLTPAAGTYALGASYAGDANNNAATAAGITGYVALAKQAALHITGVPAPLTVGMADFTLGTAGGSGAGAVTWASSDPALATVDASGLVHITATASPAWVTITATKAGDGAYAAASADAVLAIGVVPATAPAAIPALNEPALLLLTLLLAAGAALRRRG